MLIFFLLVNNLEVYFLINGGVEAAGILDEGQYGLPLLFLFLKNSLLLCTI